MTKLKLYGIMTLLLFMGFMSCSKDPDVSIQSEDEQIIASVLNIPIQPYNYAAPDLPAHFKTGFVLAQKHPSFDNPISDWGATLGRVLFYDRALSLDCTISCASCHIQAFGFTDTARFSRGVNGLTKRHSMSLVNSAYYASGRFFWDERAARLEHQVLMPIQDQLEMNLTLDSMLSRLRNTKYYPILFKYAFGDDSISAHLVSKALSQFVRAIVSYRSKYDEGRSRVNKPTDDFPNFSSSENLGKQIFFTHKLVNCSGCHLTDLMVLDNPRNNGLYTISQDSGIASHTKLDDDIGKFKSPSLRNVALRHRFMNDGSLIGLTSVIEHYDNNIQPNPHLDNHLKDPLTQIPHKMGLSPSEKQALIDFLHTLTDDALIQDKKFSNPWK